MGLKPQVNLKLHQPEQTRAERGSMLSSPSRFKAWLESLPLGNMTAAGNQLLAALKDLNQTTVSARHRTEMLDLAAGPVLTVVGVLDRHYRDTAFPLDEKKDRVGRVAVQFFRELALGYRLAAAETVGSAGSVGFLHRRSVSRWLHHALAAFEQMLVRLALLYQQPPPNIWREINTLYAFLRQNELHDKRHPADLSAHGEASAEDLFRRIALFGISDPSRLGQSAIRALAKAVSTWADRTRVMADLALETPAPGLFELDPATDEPPMLITAEAELPARYPLVFDIRPLRDWLQELQQTAESELRELAFKDVDEKPLIIGRELIAQLLATWGIRRQRTFQRLAAKHEVRLLVGINNIHFFAAGDSPFPRFLREHGDTRFVEAAVRDRARFAGGNGTESRPPVHHAEVVNQSLGGYRLRLHQVDGLQLRVGELVALSAESLSNEDAVWMLGVIRWLNAMDVREIEIGVSVIGHSTIPAALLADEAGGKPPPFRALVTTPFNGAEDRPFVIVSGMWQDKPSVSLCAAEERDTYCGPVNLAERLERTSEVSIYQFERGNPPA